MALMPPQLRKSAHMERYKKINKLKLAAKQYTFFQFFLATFLPIAPICTKRRSCIKLASYKVFFPFPCNLFDKRFFPLLYQT